MFVKHGRHLGSSARCAFVLKGHRMKHGSMHELCGRFASVSVEPLLPAPAVEVAMVRRTVHADPLCRVTARHVDSCTSFFVYAQVSRACRPGIDNGQTLMCLPSTDGLLGAISAHNVATLARMIVLSGLEDGVVLSESWWWVSANLICAHMISVVWRRGSSCTVWPPGGRRSEGAWTFLGGTVPALLPFIQGGLDGRCER